MMRSASRSRRLLRGAGLSALFALGLVPLVAAPAAGDAGQVLRTSGSVQLVAARPVLKSQCAAAANIVQFAVPCPSLVPSRNGVAMACPAPVGPQPAPCVGLEGVAEYRVFFLDFEDFDVPRGYVGVDGKRVGHVFVEARKLADAPTKPCIGGRQAGEPGTGEWRTTLYVCPPDSPFIERVARHGEGANVDHVLLQWQVDGVEYLASAHGHTTTNVALLRRMVRSMTLLRPTP